MKLSELTTLPEYFDKYIHQCDDVELLEAIQTSIDEVNNFPLEKWKALGDKVYAEGKWTVKDILQHLIDTERIFTYRVLAFARNEKQAMPMFSEDEYATVANATERTLESLIDELRAVHLSTKALFQSFSTTVLHKMGKSFNGEYSVAAIGFILPGHQRWHLKILEEKYYGLLN
jgi:DinB superfamily